MIDRLIEDLKTDEGWSPTVYKDTEGYDTIGYGFLVDVRRGGGLPKRIAEQWLEYAAQRRWWALCSKKPFLLEMPEHVQRAVGNMAYQLGVNGVIGFRNMLAALERFDFDTAAREALASRWATQTPRRAERVARLMRGEV